ncbi:hypothetical protein CAPTEDRAFT_191083, partial [Capitella teleta]
IADKTPRSHPTSPPGLPDPNAEATPEDASVCAAANREILRSQVAHRVDSVQQLLASNNIRVIFVSACCTGDLQPLDLSGNGDFKASLKECFIAWFADHLAAALDNGISTQPDLRLSTLKPLHGQWVVRAWEALRDKPNVLIHGWEEAGIKRALNETTLIID